MLDPLKKFHGVKENDNDMMDEVMSILTEIAAELRMSIEVLHHTRKPSSGNAGVLMTVDDGRGADAIIAASRSARIINGLSAKDAPALGIKETDAWRYTRIDHGKANMAPPGTAIWACSASEVLPCGESVGVLESWKLPDHFADVTTADMEWARQVTESGEYRTSKQSPKWLGYALAERLNIPVSYKGENDKKDLAKIDTIIKRWSKNKVLKLVQKKDDSGHERDFFAPGAFKPDAASR